MLCDVMVFSSLHPPPSGYHCAFTLTMHLICFFQGQIELDYVFCRDDLLGFSTMNLYDVRRLANNSSGAMKLNFFFLFDKVGKPPSSFHFILETNWFDLD